MLVSIPLRVSVSSFMGYLTVKSALMMFDKHANLKYKFENRHFTRKIRQKIKIFPVNTQRPLTESGRWVYA